MGRTVYGVTIAVAMLICGSAVAQPDLDARSKARADADARARSGSSSGAVVNQTFQGQPASTQHHQRLEYGGSHTVNNTPDVFVPSVSSGTNPCAVGASLGGSIAGFGIGGGASWSDPGCELRNLAALAHNTGRQALAQEILCSNMQVRHARARLGDPCLEDVARFAASAPQPVVTPVAASIPAAPRSNAPPFCRTQGLALILYPECN